ncbi:MAG: MATE family efflux transporter [Caldiserica bacterium]|nr:MATE family efflux transporter [Caldisericota bacterium]
MNNRTRIPTREEILHGPVVATMFRLSWPVMVSSLLNMLYNMTDTFWVGHLPAAENAAAVAGLQVAGPVVWFLVAFAFGFGSSGLALVSQFMGARNEVDAEKAAGQTMSLAILLGFAVAVIGVVLSPILLPALTPNRAISANAISYTRIIFIGMPAIFVSALYAQIMNAYGDTVTPMLINAVTVGLNVILDPLMIFGWGPFVPMGVAGAALATVLCQVLSAGISLWVLMTGRRKLRVTWPDLRPEISWVRRILRIGLPASIGASGTSFGFVVLTGIIGRVPNATVALSAYGIGDRMFSITSLINDGAGVGIATMVGQALGAGMRDRATAVVRQGTAAIVGLMAVASVLLRLITPLVFRAFIPSHPEILVEGVLFMSLFLWANPFFGLMMGVQSAFQGSGHNVPNMILDLVRLWGLRVPLAWFFAMALKLGSRGVWIGMTVSNVVAGLLSLILVFTVDWRKNVIGHLPRPEALLIGEEAVSSVESIGVDDRP